MRLPFTPSFASGCTASSRIWNSHPIDEPSPLFSSVSTKYLMPLLAPLVILNSTISSKFVVLVHRDDVAAGGRLAAAGLRGR